MTKQDKIPGGLAKGKSPKDFDPKELAMGIEVEKEHLVNDGHSKQEMHDMAQEIAMDHLTEIPDYYTRLKKMESEAEGQSKHAAGEAHAKSLALMKFLSKLAKSLGPKVGEHVYVVGGAVRDFVLDRPIKDVDVVVDSVALGRDSEWFARQVEKAIPVQTNFVTNQYGVVLMKVLGDWMLDGLNMKGEDIEIANARKESYGGEEGKGYKPHMVEPSTIEEDVVRRELTYNCMAGDTLIPTERGLLRIDQIASRESGDQQKIHLKVSGKDGPSTAVGWQYSGHTRTVKVTSDWGHQFSCTGHHPVLVFQNNEHVWVKADDLSAGDLLCVSSKGLTRTDPLPLNLSDPVKPVRGWLKEVCKPQEMTPDLAFLMGCLVSEGSNTHKRVSFSNSDPAFISRYEESFEKVFGFRPSRNQVASAGGIREFYGTPYTVSRDGFDVYADSKTVVGWLGELGLYMGGRQNGKSASHFKVVPWSILQTDRQSQSAFLAAYLEGDGSIESKSGRITFISKSPTLRRQIQALLGSHGILSRVQGRFVLLNAVDSALLWSEIEPFMVSKRFDYGKRTFKSRNRFGIPKDYLAGFLEGRRLRSAGRAGMFYQTDDGGEVALRGVGEAIRTIKRLLHDAYARGDFDAFLENLDRISSVEAQKLRHLFGCSYQYVPVASVEEDGERDVYDISMHKGVEPAFVANGVVVHNTLLMRLIDLANGPDKKDIVDLTGCGLKDLEEGRMQCPRDPDIVFSDDPSRMIRVIKYALRYGHKLTPDTLASIRRNAGKLANIPSSHLAQMLTQIVLTEKTWKQALKMMDHLDLLEPVRGVLLKDKSFKSTMENYVNSQRMDMLFGLLDVGLPLGAGIGFLDAGEQTRLREITLGMDRAEAWDFVGMLKNPGNAWKDKKFMPELAREYGFLGKGMATLAPEVSRIGRELLLDQPEMAKDPVRLKRLVREQVERVVPRLQRTAGDDDSEDGTVKLAAPEKYKDIDFKPPESVANAAKKGLEYRQKASPSNRGGLTSEEAGEQGIGSGVQRATNLKNRDTLSPETVKQMAAFFSRHEKNKSIAAEHKDEPWNDKGHVSWLLWGGDAGKAWADKVIKQMEAADERAKKVASYKVAKEIPFLWVVEDPTKISELGDIVWGTDNPRKLQNVLRGAGNDWPRRNPVFHDSKSSAVKDAMNRLRSLHGVIPEWVVGSPSPTKLAGDKVALEVYVDSNGMASDDEGNRWQTRGYPEGTYFGADARRLVRMDSGGGGGYGGSRYPQRAPKQMAVEFPYGSSDYKEWQDRRYKTYMAAWLMGDAKGSQFLKDSLYKSGFTEKQLKWFESLERRYSRLARQLPDDLHLVFYNGRSPGVERMPERLRESLQAKGWLSGGSAPVWIFGGAKNGAPNPPEQDSSAAPDTRKQQLEALDLLLAKKPGDRFLQSLADQVRRGRRLSEKQTAALRRNFYQVGLRDQAGLFKAASTLLPVTGNGKSVGLFIRVPEELAAQFPVKFDEPSPAHVTLLIVGEVPEGRREEFSRIVQDVCDTVHGPIKAHLAGVDHFVHPGGDRKVFYSPVRFSKDVAEIRDRLWVSLEDAGFEIKDGFPMAYNPHVTLGYIPDAHDGQWDGASPGGSWEFNTIEAWDLPELLTFEFRGRVLRNPTPSELRRTAIRKAYKVFGR